MSKFDELYSKSHVKDHPWFRNQEDHIAGMRQAMQKKSEEEFSLHDVFNEKKQIGLKSGDRTLNAYIQEAAITAREALNSFDFPVRPQIAYNNSRQVKFASHDPTQVVEAEILFNVKIATVSGVMKTATMPLKVISGMVVPPSVLVFDGRMKTLGQSTVDELVLRHTSYSLRPTRGMFSPPMTFTELETAVATRNEVGYQPREMVMEGYGARRNSSLEVDAEMDPEVARWYKMYQASGSSPEDAIELAKEQADKMNTKTSRKMRIRRAQTAKVAQAATHVDPYAETGAWDFNNMSPFNVMQDQFAGPGAGESQEIDISPDDTSFLYGQILANKDIMRWMTDAMNPSIDQVVDNVFEAVSPFVESLHLDASRIDWYSLASDLQNYLGKDRPKGARITKLTARRVAFITSEYLTLRRRFGYRMAASDADAEIAQWRSTLESTGPDNMSPEEKAFVKQMLDAAQVESDKGDASSAHDLAEQVRPFFDANGLTLNDADLAEGGVFEQSGFQDPATFFQDAPATTGQDPATFFQDAPATTGQDPATFFQQNEDVPKKLWGSLMARLERQGRSVKVAGGTPLGYLEVVEAMMEAEEAGLDTFPRPFIHVARNYIMTHTNTASQNHWMPHLINDGFVINPLGMNRGRTRRASVVHKLALNPTLKHQVDSLYQKYIRATDEVEVENIVSQIFKLGDEAADYFNNKMEMNLPGDMEVDMDEDELRYASKKKIHPGRNK